MNKDLKARAAEAAHYSTNLLYWACNPNFTSGIYPADLAFRAFRSLPVSPYDLAKAAIYKQNVIAVNGESVVAPCGDSKVDKFMFVRPSGLGLFRFAGEVKAEIDLVTSRLGQVAAPTEVSVKRADIFNDPWLAQDATAQTQPWFDPTVFQPLDLEELLDSPDSKRRDNAARDAEYLATESRRLQHEDGLVPDVPTGSDNLRIAPGGQLILWDLMPIHTDGSRLVPGNINPNLLSSALEGITQLEDFAGQYGA